MIEVVTLDEEMIEEDPEISQEIILEVGQTVRCLMQLVLIVEINAKYHFNQEETKKFYAQIVLKKKVETHEELQIMPPFLN